ncbi:MAG: type II secretion system protein GspG, partial [Elusimicrobiota bacterium]|nr:type II secretion system protein GspG [Elusimicrobiota bacterium]
IQIGLRMYYADVGLFPIKAKDGDGIGYDGLSDWQDYLISGDRIGASANDEDTDNDQKIDNWHGKYIDEPSTLTDPWGNSFLYINNTWSDGGKKSGILCWGPLAKTGTGASTDWANYLRSNGTAFSWASGTKDITDPPDEEGFSVFYRDGDPANEKTDFITVLWME